MITRVVENKKELLQNSVLDVIHNRFDLLFGDDFELFKVGEYYVPVFINDVEAKVGLYLTYINPVDLTEFCKYLFLEYPKLQKLFFLHTYTQLPNIVPAPHWHIDLPDSIEEFNAGLHSKVRYNTKWYPKKIREDIGDYVIEKYELSEITEDIVKQYFEWKKETHNYTWSQNPLEYLKQVGVTNSYILLINQCPEAIAFTCETGENVFLENFSYNPAYSKYSLGMVLYHFIISDLINNNKNKFYLLGGTLDYKRRYNGIKTMTYSGYVFRYPEKMERIEGIANSVNSLFLPYFIKKLIVMLYALFNLDSYHSKILKKLIRKCV